MKQQVKQVPYGVSDFATVMSQNLYYVDKTKFLPELEKQPRNLFFVRPRRFGKSLFLSMLYSYYDCNQKENFEKLFGSLWIGQHPTSLQGIYQVLFLDFSQITGKIEILEERFNAYLCIKLDSFAEQYAAYYGDKKVQEIKTKTQYADKMQIIFDAARANHFQLYLIIDEYDNFTNVVLNEHGEKVYHAITHADGFPNNNVRKQYYGYLEEEYQAKSYVDTNRLTDYYYDMAYDGIWEEGLRFMAEAYAKVSSVRDGIESERNLQGFFMAYLNLNDYYITVPELELNHGYCDFFLLPDHTHYASQHSYILELKVLSRKEFDEELKDVFKEDGSPMKKSEKQWLDAVEQIRRYADAPRVEALRQGTTLHKIIMQFKGWELARIEEIE